jgi:hypothetical protein
MIKIPTKSVKALGVMTVKKIMPRNMPTKAAGRINLRIRQLAFFKNRLIPTKSIAISSGNKIAKASFKVDGLAMSGNESTPKPAPNPLFEIPTTTTLAIAQMKNASEWV